MLPLCNFTAEVVKDVIKDDGLEPVRIFEITGRLASGRRLPTLTVPADRFYTMTWVAQWGVDAVISAGMGVKDRLREAIQLASKGAKQEQIFTHIGWRKFLDKWVYLYAGGAVGVLDILVEPDEGLERYSLPADGDVKEGLAVSLKLLEEIAAPDITFPLWAAVFRAPTAFLLYPTFVLWLCGETGSLKSTLAALFLSHYGAFTKDSLPASWLSTDNALEQQAFLCRDAILVVDDYSPERNPREAAALDRRVNRFVRQIGNRSARDRMTADLHLRKSFTPNALVVSTGEQLPLAVSSVAARIFPVNFSREKIGLQKVTEAQLKAHLLPQAMRGYLKWLAPQLDSLAKELPCRFFKLREKAIIKGHARLPETVAHLQIGMELGLKFAVYAGVITEKRAQELEALCWELLLDLAREHAKTLEEEKPTIKFIQTLDAIFAQGKGYLLSKSGKKPEMAERFGWADLAYSGDLLGWIDEDAIYLIPEAAWRAVQEYLRGSGGFPVRERTLREMLLKEEILLPDMKTGWTTQVVRIGESLRRVLCLNKHLYLKLLA